MTRWNEFKEDFISISLTIFLGIPYLIFLGLQRIMIDVIRVAYGKIVLLLGISLASATIYGIAYLVGGK